MADFNDIIKDSKPTLVDFFATWCGPCKLQGPILEEVKNKLGDSVNILKVDVDQNQELSQADMLEEKLREHIPDKSDE